LPLGKFEEREIIETGATASGKRNSWRNCQGVYFILKHANHAEQKEVGGGERPSAREREHPELK